MAAAARHRAREGREGWSAGGGACEVDDGSDHRAHALQALRGGVAYAEHACARGP